MNAPEVDAAALRRLAHGLLFDADAAGDVVQEAWLAALRQGREPTQPWLAEAVKRIALGARRQSRRRREREQRSARPEGQVGGAETAARLEVLRTLLAALERLDEPYQTAVVMRYLDDLPPREIARRTGVRVGTARAHVSRGLERLRRDLDGPEGRGREALLGALLPLAGTEPWKLALASAPAAGTMTLAGVLIVKKTALSVVALLALLAVSWIALRGPAKERGEVVAEVASEALAIEDTVTPVRPESIADETLARVEAAVAAPGTTWTQRGRVTVGVWKPLPHGKLLARMLRGAGLDGEVLHEQSLTADEAGLFTWTFDAPTELVTLAVRGDLPRAICTTSWATYAPGDLTDYPWTIQIHPLDLELRGRVLGPDGRPVPGARVVQRRFEADGEAECDADGRYRIEASSVVEPGTLWASAEGFLEARVQFSSTEGDGVLDLPDVQLEHARTLAGRVLDEHGAPIEGAQVSTWSNFRHCVVLSGVDGTFELPGIDPTSERVTVYARQDGYVPLQDALTIDGPPAELVLQRGLEVSGRVVREDGTAVENARIALGSPLGREGEPTTRSDRLGHFTLAPVPAGAQHLWISASGLAQVRQDLELPREPGRHESGDVVLPPQRTLRGRVLDRDDSPLAWALVYVEDPLRRAGRGVLTNHSMHTGEDGRFVIQGLPEARMTVGVLAEGHARLELDLEHLVDHELILRPDPAAGVAGRVVDASSGQPILRFRVKVNALWDAPPEHRLKSGPAYWGSGAWVEHPEGHWRMDADLPADRWVKVEVEAQGYAPASVEPVVTAIDPDPTACTVALVRETVVRGQVVDPYGAPVAGALVQLAEQRESPKATTDVAGRFELRGLAAGEVTLAVEAEGFARRRDGPFEVGGAPLQRRIELDRGARLVGRLLGEDGRPLTGERIGLIGITGSDRNSARQVLTDDEGRYAFEGLAPGVLDLSWQRILDGETWNLQTRAVDVAALATVEADLVSSGSCTLQGTISSEVAVPAGTRVRVTAMAAPDPSKVNLDRNASITRASRTVIAEDGRFVIRGLEPGSYILMGLCRTHPRTYVSGSLPVLELAANATVEVELVLK